ncbi:MAG: von Willebrand factor type A domain-containing protein, partial [Sphingobacteriales bacterium]
MRTIIALLFSGWLLTAFLPTAQIEITGQIVDKEGAPVPFASIIVKGTSKGVSADQFGYFTITVPDEKTVLEVSAVGFEASEIKIGKQTKLKVKLKVMDQALRELEDVVVTGYPVQRKRDITGSVTTINAKELNSAYAPSQQLSGRAAGVQIRVRGIASTKSQYPQPEKDWNTEGYDHIDENGFKAVQQDPLSTFSLDVDAASYSNVRRFLNQGTLPPAGAVRVEEMINYFQYGYAQPKGEHPFSVYTELADCPWQPEHKLLLVGLQGKKVETRELPASNITFLIDVSGSMNDENKLPLVKGALKLLADQLREQDRVSIVVYAGAAGLVLEPTSDKTKIKQALDQLEAGGSTAGGAGIQLAYHTARQNFIKGGNNRVILCTDGDFNVGASSDDAMVSLIEKERASGVFLTVLGFGMGNYQDAKMQKLADKGNGTHAYIDQMSEAKKIFVNEFGGTLFTIAKDVKFQLEFNPAQVQGYRLIGYENRILNKEDFNDDKKDAGEMGSGHTVTALYEIIPTGVETELLGNVDPLRYSKKEKNKMQHGDELLLVKLRYKKPNENTSKLMEVPVSASSIAYKQASGQFRLAAAVATFGMILS